jgi:hypothetical protein
MNFLRKYYSQIIFLFIGFLVGLIINRLPIQFEQKTSWVPFANFFLTILIAVYLEFVVRPSFSNNRNEKDILIDQLKEIQKSVTGIQQLYEQLRKAVLTSEDKSQLIQKLRSLSNEIDFLKTSDQHCTITKNKKIIKPLFGSYIGYKKALTGNGFDKDGFSYDRLYWKEQEGSFKGLIKAVIHSIIDINKI